MHSLIPNLAAVVISVSLAVGARAADGIDPFTCDNTAPIEPIVLWDVTGETFAGLPIHGTLTVYNNGMASVASRVTGDIRTALVGVAAARALRARLVNVGAAVLCDGPEGADLPVTTLTLLDGQPNALAHTFSYWAASGPYAGVQAVIDTFLAQNFQGFSLY